MGNLDRNGYGLSILQDDESRCYICGRTNGKLDRHEVFQASNRKKSKELGFWVVLCRGCHEHVHRARYLRDMLHERGQIAAMNTYNLTTDEFINLIGRNYL